MYDLNELKNKFLPDFKKFWNDIGKVCNGNDERDFSYSTLFDVMQSDLVEDDLDGVHNKLNPTHFFDSLLH